MKRRVLLAVAGGAVILLGFLATPRLLRRVTFFRVRQVELVGVRYIAPDALLETLGPGVQMWLERDDNTSTGETLTRC